MSRLEMLEQRRDLVLRSAKLQRATIAIRLNRIEARRGMGVVDLAFDFLQKPWARRVAIVALGVAWRSFRRKPRG